MTQTNDWPDEIADGSLYRSIVFTYGDRAEREQYLAEEAAEQAHDTWGEMADADPVIDTQAQDRDGTLDEALPDAWLDAPR